MWGTIIKWAVAWVAKQGVQRLAMNAFDWVADYMMSVWKTLVEKVEGAIAWVRGKLPF